MPSAEAAPRLAGGSTAVPLLTPQTHGIAGDGHTSAKLPLLARVTHALHRSRPLRLVAIALPVLLALVSAVSGGLGLRDHTAGYAATPSSVIGPAYTAYEALNSDFGRVMASHTEAVLITRIPAPSTASDAPRTILGGDTQALSDDIVEALWGAPGADKAVRGVAGYYTLVNTSLAPLAGQYVSPAMDATIVAVTLDTSPGSGATTYLAAASPLISGLQASHPGFSAIVTGQMSATAAEQLKLGKGFAIVNGIGLPFIAVVFWLRVRSLRLLLLPAVSLGVSLAVSYGASTLVAAHSNLSVPAYEPDVILFLCMALAVDYSFFLLTRFQAERTQRGAESPVVASVAAMLSTSGHTVAVSGAILVVAWLADVFVPVYGIDGVGVCSSLTVLVCVASNLVLTPALLLECPTLCGRVRVPAEAKGKGKPRYAAHNDGGVIDGGNATGADGSTSVVRSSGAQEHAAFESCYGRLASRLVRWPAKLVVPLVVVALLLAGASQVLHLRLSVGLNVDFGTGNVADAYGRVLAEFGAVAGISVPFIVVVPALTQPAPAHVRSLAGPWSGGSGEGHGCDDRSECGVFAPAYLASSCAIAAAIGGVHGVDASSVRAHSVARAVTPASRTPFACVNATEALALATARVTRRADTAAAVYQHTLSSLVDQDTNASALVTFVAAFDPFSDRVEPMIADVRDAIAAALAQHSGATRDAAYGGHGGAAVSHTDLGLSASHVTGVASALLYHPEVVEVDSKAFAVARLPWVLLACLCTMFGLVAVAYGAAIVPLKLAVSIALPVLFVYGLAVRVYQYGDLDALGWGPLSSRGASGLSWLLPPATVFLTCGLATDYELFLFGRVLELRAGTAGGRRPLATEDAIVAAVDKTGRTITSAGTIMALAFAGMLANSNRFLNQFGAIMIASVLLDTFLVRTVLVPAMLSVGGWVNWWPRAMPAVDRSTAAA